MVNSLASWVPLVLCVCGLKAVFFNHSCVFPFVYGEVTHYGCTSVHSDFAWCSLDETFQGRWRYCTGADPPKCTFPFLFGKKLINRCTREGYAV
ncbi:binder of sperm protein 2 precursor-like protein [Camelus ferus]|nr:binder of sperm protein 2 precursor-like protein [Camelus ferus]